MTTIAFKDNVLCADGKSMIGGALNYDTNHVKIYASIGPFAVIAGAGSAQDIEDTLDTLTRFTQVADARALDFKENNIEATFIAQDFTGDWWSYQGTHSCRLNPDIPFAIGSGGDFALGAMYAGHSALESIVKVAALLDPGTNANVTMAYSEVTEDGVKVVVRAATDDDLNDSQEK